MKQQKLGLTIKLFKNKVKGNMYQLILVNIALIIFLSCKNDLEKIHLYSEETVIPNLSGKNVFMFRSDSARLNVKIIAPEVKRFDNIDEPYVEFPKGVEVFFLDSAQNIKTYITAKYAIRYEQQNLYYARDSVVSKNVKTNEWIKSEEMFWDEEKGIIYSNKFTIIERKDGIFYGYKGFECTQDLSYWNIKGSKQGKIILSDETE